MNYDDLSLCKARTIEDWKSDENVLLIGRRGSTTIGLTDANSDVDYLIVTRDSDRMSQLENVTLDVNVVTLSRFKYMLMRLSIETIETLYNVEHIAEEFEAEAQRMRDFVESCEDAHFLFWYQVWLMLKNQLKQYRKGVNNNKFGSKIVLYGLLLKDANILDFWTHKRVISDEVKNEYFRVRHGGVSNIDEIFIRTVEVERADSERRAELRDRSNRILNRIEKSGILN